MLDGCDDSQMFQHNKLFTSTVQIEMSAFRKRRISMMNVIETEASTSRSFLFFLSSIYCCNYLPQHWWRPFRKLISQAFYSVNKKKSDSFERGKESTFKPFPNEIHLLLRKATDTLSIVIMARSNKRELRKKNSLFIMKRNPSKTE